MANNCTYRFDTDFAKLYDLDSSITYETEQDLYDALTQARRLYLDKGSLSLDRNLYNMFLGFDSTNPFDTKTAANFKSLISKYGLKYDKVLKTFDMTNHKYEAFNYLQSDQKMQLVKEMSKHDTVFLKVVENNNVFELEIYTGIKVLKYTLPEHYVSKKQIKANDVNIDQLPTVENLFTESPTNLEDYNSLSGQLGDPYSDVNTKKSNVKFNHKFDGKSINFKRISPEIGTEADVVMRQVANGVIVEIANNNLKSKSSSRTSFETIIGKEDFLNRKVSIEEKEQLEDSIDINNGKIFAGEDYTADKSVVMLARNNEIHKINSNIDDTTKKVIDEFAQSENFEKFVVGNSYIDKPFIDYLLEKGYDFEIYGLAGKDRITEDYINQNKLSEQITNQNQKPNLRETELIDNYLIEKQLLDGNHYYYINQDYTEKDKPVLITKDNIKEAIQLNKVSKPDGVIVEKQGKKYYLIGDLTEPLIKFGDNSSYIEIYGTKDLLSFINDATTTPKEKEKAIQLYNDLKEKAGINKQPNLQQVDEITPDLVELQTNEKTVKSSLIDPNTMQNCINTKQ